jgi:hypothetical protein
MRVVSNQYENEYSIMASFKQTIILVAVCLVVLLIIMVLIKSKRHSYEPIDDIMDDESNDANSDTKSIILDSDQYNLFDEITSFMDKQTQYVMKR